MIKKRHQKILMPFLFVEVPDGFSFQYLYPSSSQDYSQFKDSAAHLMSIILQII
jgi:hypothetical protein